MAILWCGGEDVDLPHGASVSILTAGSQPSSFRSAFSRCAVYTSTASGGAYSNAFAGGGVTSCWFSFIAGDYPNPPGGPNSAGMKYAGITHNSLPSAGIYIGSDSSNYLFPALYKSSDGMTFTKLASTSTVPISSPGRYDVQIINYGTTGTIVVYCNGSQIMSYTGDIRVGAAPNLDTVVVRAGTYSFGTGGSATGWKGASEIVVADESTLGFQGLATLAPNGNGATQNWSNPAYTNVNPITINDANTTYTNTVGQDEQLTMNSLPSGTFQVKAVKVIARASATSGATATGLKLGFNNTNNGTVAEGATHTLGTGFSPVEDLFATDPTNGGAHWGANLNGYQLELRSA